MPSHQPNVIGCFVPRIVSTLVPWIPTTMQIPKAKLSPIQLNSATPPFPFLHCPQKKSIAQIVAGALTGAALPTSISQVDAIANLWDIFESWRLLAPLSFWPTQIPTMGRPRVPTQELPRVVSPPLPTQGHPMSPIPAWSPHSRPAASTLLLPALVLTPFQFQATP